jgi:flavin-dependent dehydrogenase
MAESRFDIIVIGGGPAGAMASLSLVRAGYSVCLVERRIFPRETLCGEFLSHEVVSIIRDLGIEREFLLLNPVPIMKFALCPESGPMVSKSLGFTAYGLKRGAFDQFLLNTAMKQGVHVLQPAEVEAIIRSGDGFEVQCRLNEAAQMLQSKWCVGAYGKTAPLDKQLHRPFAGTRTHMNGIKFHVPSADLAGMNADEIRIFTGREMYCGINHVDGGVATICFLERRIGDVVSPRARLRELATANKYFASVVEEGVMSAIDVAPIYGAGNIYFGRRNVVENGIFMVGDAAQVISPLAGDGIGMALQSAQLLGKLFSEHRNSGRSAKSLEMEYRNRWEQTFSSRLRTAGALQNMMLSTPLRHLGTSLLSLFPSLLEVAIGMTRSRLHQPGLTK